MDTSTTSFSEDHDKGHLPIEVDGGGHTRAWDNGEQGEEGAAATPERAARLQGSWVPLVQTLRDTGQAPGNLPRGRLVRVRCLAETLGAVPDQTGGAA